MFDHPTGPKKLKYDWLMAKLHGDVESQSQICQDSINFPIRFWRNLVERICLQKHGKNVTNLDVSVRNRILSLLSSCLNGINYPLENFQWPAKLKGNKPFVFSISDPEQNTESLSTTFSQTVFFTFLYLATLVLLSMVASSTF